MVVLNFFSLLTVYAGVEGASNVDSRFSCKFQTQFGSLLDISLSLILRLHYIEKHIMIIKKKVKYCTALSYKPVHFAAKVVSKHSNMSS